MRVLRSGGWIGTVLVTAALTVGCAGGNDGDLSLNLDTLEATVPEGTFHAEPIPNAHVGAITDQLYIAVAVDITAPEDVTVYLCDSEEIGVWLSGTMTGEEFTIEDEAVGVEAVIDGDAITGTVSLAGEDPQSFTVQPASGDAGLYRADATFDDGEASAGWIVLSDDSQRGFWWSLEEAEEEELQM